MIRERSSLPSREQSSRAQRQIFEDYIVLFYSKIVAACRQLQSIVERLIQLGNNQSSQCLVVGECFMSESRLRGNASKRQHGKTAVVDLFGLHGKDISLRLLF